jgi:hypothetical protein
VEREQPELDAEGDEEADRHGDGRAGGDLGDPHGHVAHRQGAGDPVGAGDREQEDERPQQVDRGDDDRGPQVGALRAVGGEYVRRDHGHLEEHVEVEDVAGEEEAVEPRREEDQQSGERAFSDADDGLRGRRHEQHDGGQQGEGHAQGVGL